MPSGIVIPSGVPPAQFRDSDWSSWLVCAGVVWWVGGGGGGSISVSTGVVVVVVGGWATIQFMSRQIFEANRSLGYIVAYIRLSSR